MAVEENFKRWTSSLHLSYFWTRKPAGFGKAQVTFLVPDIVRVRLVSSPQRLDTSHYPMPRRGIGYHKQKLSAHAVFTSNLLSEFDHCHLVPKSTARSRDYVIKLREGETERKCQIFITEVTPRKGGIKLLGQWRRVRVYLGPTVVCCKMRWREAPPTNIHNLSD